MASLTEQPDSVVDIIKLTDAIKQLSDGINEASESGLTDQILTEKINASKKQLDDVINNIVIPYIEGQINYILSPHACENIFEESSETINMN